MTNQCDGETYKSKEKKERQRENKTVRRDRETGRNKETRKRRQGTERQRVTMKGQRDRETGAT